jgi:hypothetical protein
VPSGGNDPAFAVALSTGEVAITNHSSGDRCIIPTTTSPEHYNNNVPVKTFPPSARGVSHPHLNVSDGTRVYSIAGSIPQPMGSGPVLTLSD